MIILVITNKTMKVIVNMSREDWLALEAGKIKEIEFGKVSCSICAGTGEIKSAMSKIEVAVPCSTCFGTGEVDGIKKA